MNKTRVIILGMTFMLMIITFLNAETLLSDAGVEYESEILDVFNANNQTELRVGIELKDKSGINITGTKEERRTQLRQIDEWFQPKIERLLADYSNDSSIIFSSRMLNGFVAIVNKEGFDKLANDYRISKIFLDKPVYPGEKNLTTDYNKIEKNKSSEKIIKGSQIEKNNLVFLLILMTIGILLFLLVIWFFHNKK